MNMTTKSFQFCLVFFLLLIQSLTVTAQREKKLSFKSGFWGYNYFEGGNRISRRDALQLLNGQPEAIKLFTKGGEDVVFGYIFSAAGGFMIGWPIGEAIAGKKDPQWPLLAGGFAGLIVGGALEKSFKRKTRQAFDLYNQGTVTSYWKVGTNGTGISITYTF